MFCTKCGNQLKDGAKFCTKCGAPVKMPEPVVVHQPAVEVQPIPAPVAAPQPVAEVRPTPAPAPKKAANTKGISLIFGIIAAAFCLFALISCIVGTATAFNIRALRGIIGLFLILNIVAYVVGIATGFLSKKLAFLAAIPLPILIVANIIEFSRAFLYAPPTPGAIRMVLTQQKGFLGEIVIAFFLLALFIVSVIMKNKVGIILGAITAFLAGFLAMYTIYSIISPFARNYMVMKNPRMLFDMLRLRLYSIGRIPFYASYIALAVGVCIRNVKAVREK